MGAKWQRDTSGQSKPAPKPPAFQQPIRPGKRKLVWTKDQQDQPAPSRPGQSNGHLNPGPAGPYDQYDHFEKRARLNQDFQGYQGAQHHRHVIQQQAPYPASDRVKPPTNGEQHHKHASHQQAPHTKPVGANAPANDTQQQPPLARQDPAAVLAQRQKAAELAELKRRIQLQEDALKRQKKEKEAVAEQQVQEQRHEQSKRRAKLEAGFSQAFKRAKEVADSELAQHKSPPKLASEEEVRRVLAAKTDYDCLQLPAGSDAVTIKRKYRELAVALHPDKCKAEGATDAFQRLVKAYQNTLKLAKQI